MSEQQKQLTRRFYDEVLSHHKLQVIDELCAPGIVDHTPLPGQQPGRQGFKHTLEEYLQAFPDLNVTVHDMISEGDVVCVRLTGQATHKGAFMGAQPTGKKVTFHGIDMIRIDNGKATEVWHEGNDALVLAQIGVRMPVAT
jgi:steroid delta-isomerase-like uncharacterized protein